MLTRIDMGNNTDFYPRSPCGERLDAMQVIVIVMDFYPRSPCGERPVKLFRQNYECFISIHALLAESDRMFATLFCGVFLFLSTLSLRRATQVFQRIAKPFRISIHALLAESDQLYINRAAKTVIFLSTLSLRRATGY